jgi:hypothetical protein
MSVKNYKNRFFSLLESEMGDVRPLVNESGSIYSDEELEMMRNPDIETDMSGMKEMTYDDVKDFQDKFISSKVGFDIKTNFPHSSDSEKMKMVLDAERELRDLISQAGMEIYRER